VNLLEAQTLFHGLLAGEIPPDDPRIAAEFVSDARLPASARLAIYADMFLSRQVEALQAEFPMLFALLGDCAFADLAREYIGAHPSQHPDIAQLGRKLGEFIRRHSGVRGDLAELAELERARSLAFSAEDWSPRKWEELAAVGPEGFASTRLKFVPALRTFSARVDLMQLWQGLQKGEKPPPIELDGPVTIAVWKNGFEVFHSALSNREAAALESAVRGATLGEVCEAFADAEDPAGTAFQTLASWFNEGWVAAIAPPDA
jgi:hypothetical protein